MIDIDVLYFNWLMNRFDDVSPSFERLARMLHENAFQRRVGNDVNRAIDGENLRKIFLDDYQEVDIDPSITNDFLHQNCSWLEMLVALSESLDFLYDLGAKEHYIELIDNLGLLKLLFGGARSDHRYDEIDQDLVDAATNRVDYNLFDRDGHGGLFPLTKPGHPDQRRVEIWDQHAAYFGERLEGVMWTSTN